jgi:hypothetical protein
MTKTKIFLLIIVLVIIGRYILYPLVIGTAKILIGLVFGLGVIALIALIVYVVHQTSKHK